MERDYGYDVHQDNPDVLAKKIPSKMLIVHDTDDRTIPYLDTKTLSDHSNSVFLHTTHGLGHKQILKDNAVINVVASYIFNGQVKHDDSRDIPLSTNLGQTYFLRR
jgi:hypothetical protein